jgi:hypothetical protein
MKRGVSLGIRGLHSENPYEQCTSIMQESLAPKPT